MAGNRPTAALVDVDWNETSGVDHPANEVEGWVVMKAGDADAFDEIEAILKDEEEAVQKDERLLDALSGADLADAPDNVKGAAKIVRSWLEKQGYGKGGKQDSKKAEDDEAGSAEPSRLRRIVAALRDMVSAEKMGGGRKKKPMGPDETMKAIQDAWPTFAADVAAVAHSDQAVPEKLAAVDKAVDSLRALVSAALAEIEEE